MGLTVAATWGRGGWGGLKSWLDAGLTFLYPPVCQMCGWDRATVEDGYVCGSCWRRHGGLRYVEPPFCERCGLPHEGAVTTTYACANCRDMELGFSTARAAVRARGVVLELIHRYKYHRALWFEPFLAGLLQQQAIPWLQAGAWDLVAPVPLHPVKEREREFNQAGRLGRRLAAAASLPFAPGALRRVQPTPSQTALTRAARARNVRRAFSMSPGVSVRGARVVLVDDVMTTGATASACASTLREAGAVDVCVWTVARAVFEPVLSADAD